MKMQTKENYYEIYRKPWSVPYFSIKISAISV